MPVAPRCLLPALLLLLSIHPTALRAEEEAESTPAERYAAAQATFPEPSAKHAVSFDGLVEMRGVKIGTMTLRLEPVEQEEGRVLWRLSENLDLLGGGVFCRMEGLLDRELRLVSGTAAMRPTVGPEHESVWRAVGGEWEIRRSKPAEGVDPAVVRATASGPVTAGYGALCLLSRHVLPESGEFEFRVINPSKKCLEEPFVTATWTVRTDAMWEGRRVWAGAGTYGGDRLEWYFELLRFIILFINF